jgi:dTDP-4-amino-4,6-dideoxygalactose transaminase
MPPLPVMRPMLPTAPQLLPYLARIDQSRIYSNFGPLAAEFEARLEAHFGVARHGVTTVANGTLGLTLALTAQDAKPGTLCVMPAWTFVASPQAAVTAGLVPFFVDVDATTWALHPDAISDVIGRAPGPVGAVMPVVPFGRPIDFAGWDRFRAKTGLPVVIDAAAGFDSLQPTDTPAVVSLHATKALGVGEGGFVLTTDPRLFRSILTRANFGFDGNRNAIVPALNAKLSEYHAAIGLAALDEWPLAQSQWLAAARAYRERLASADGVRLQDGFGESWVSSVCVVHLGDRAMQVDASLRQANIETRHWWGDGAHAHQSTAHYPRTTLPITEQLARTTLAIPFFRDMQPTDADRVIACVASSGA